LAKYIFHNHSLDPVDQTKAKNNKKEEEDHDEHIQEDRIVGTYGYMDPLYAQTGNFLYLVYL
jgi:hypothetical protein